MPRTSDDIHTLAFGLYDALIDERLQSALQANPELRAVLSKVDPEEQPARYAAFVAKVVESALRHETKPSERLDLCNRLIAILSEHNERIYLAKHKIVSTERQVLSEITPPHYGKQGIPRPETSITESSLFTGSPREPQLVHEVQKEMRSADEVEILVSFIKWSGLQLLVPAFEELRGRNIPVRLITTSYMGASDARAVEWLARMPNIQVKVSL